MTISLTALRQRLGMAFVTATSELDAAINDAIGSVRGEMFYKSSTPPTITLASDTYEYSLSSAGLARIQYLIMEDSAGKPNLPIERNHWRLISGPTLVFESTLWSPTVGREVQIYGQKVQANLSAGADLLYIDEAYVLAQARSILHMNRAAPVSDDLTPNPNAEAHMRNAQFWQGIAERERMRHPYRPDPSSVVVPGAV